MIFFLGILFVLFIVNLIGTAVSQKVPDEIEASGKYLEMAPDALLLVLIGLSLYAFGYPVLALAVPAAIIILRNFSIFEQLYGILTGAVLGLTFQSEMFVMLCLIVLVFNYVWGLLGHKWKIGIWQPITAVLILGIPWLHP